MRLLELDLERYGPFTGKRLAFRPDARLHVVHGPNEAGKSCSLAAVTDLFFGIERGPASTCVQPARSSASARPCATATAGRCLPPPQEQAAC